MSATRKQVAELANVSTCTVSNVINGTKNVSEATKSRVLEAIRQLDYHPNMIAKSLVTAHSHHLAVITDDVKDPHHAAVLEAVNLEAQKHGYFVSVCIREKELQPIINGLLARQIDGVFLSLSPSRYSPDGHDLVCLQQLYNQHIPTAFGYQAPIESPHTCVVRLNFDEAVCMAIDELSKLGHKKIGMINLFPPDYPFDHRGATFIHYMQERFGSESPAYVHGLAPYPGNITYGAIYATQLLEQHPDITAIITGNESMAIGCIAQIQRKGWRVPEDISVISLGDLALTSCYFPAVSSISFDLEAYGREIVNHLLCAIKGKEMHNCLMSYIPHLRETTCSPRKQ